MSSTTDDLPLSPTTGEPVAVVAARNRLGVYLLVVVDFMGTMALVITYAYLWALNVNNGWAPPGSQFSAVMSNGVAPAATDTAFAPDGPFWAIAAAVIVTSALAWWAYRLVRRGDIALATTVSGAAAVLAAAALVAQWWQVSTLPFAAGNGSYASTVLVLLAGNVVHLLLVLFLLIGIVNRVRLGRVTRDDPWQAQLVAIWLTWIAVAFVLGAFLTTAMKASPNENPTMFGGFDTRSAVAPSASPSPSS